jgi:hypothetical protein
MVAAVAGLGAWRFGGDVVQGVQDGLSGGLVAVRERGAVPAFEVASAGGALQAGAAGAAPHRAGEAPQGLPGAADVSGGPAATAPAAGAEGVAAPPAPQGMPAEPAMVTVTAPDSGSWQPAVARTWVNVRSDASREGEVIGVISPESKALLGSGRAGWRRVRFTNGSGWVDPRLFEPDSVGTRG